MARPLLHTDALRRELLGCAAELMAATGPAGVSLRQVAAAAGTSTTAIYSLFGGKQELFSAVVTDGFRSFSASQAEAEGLLELGRAYRAWALEHPALYGLMFAGVRGVEVACAPEDAVAAESMLPLLAAVTAALGAGAGGEDPLTVAGAIWGQVHGLVSLELAGVPLPGVDWEHAYEVALRGIGRAYTQ